MWVELDIYSGRPNPRWTFSFTEAKTVTDLYKSLPAGGAAAARIEDGLGYRGFRIFDSQSNLLAVVQGARVRVYEGATTTPDLRIDEARQLELMLFRMSRPHLSPGTFAFLQSQLDT